MYFDDQHDATQKAGLMDQDNINAVAVALMAIHSIVVDLAPGHTRDIEDLEGAINELFPNTFPSKPETQS